MKAMPDRIRPCSVCNGERILIDIVGESVCGWCDGSGHEENPEFVRWAEEASLEAPFLPCERRRGR